MVFVMETMVEDKKLEVVRSQCGFDLGLCLSRWVILGVWTFGGEIGR